MYAGVTNDFRVKTLGLAPPSLCQYVSPLTERRVSSPYAYSSQLVPTPAVFRRTSTSLGIGFCNSGQLGNQWECWYATAGPPPVYVGFGSMTGTTGAKRAQIVIDARAHRPTGSPGKRVGRFTDRAAGWRAGHSGGGAP